MNLESVSNLPGIYDFLKPELGEIGVFMYGGETLPTQQHLSCFTGDGSPKDKREKKKNKEKKKKAKKKKSSVLQAFCQTLLNWSSAHL